VSTTQISVQSADKVTQTYTVTSDTVVNAGRDGIGTVKVNDKVSVTAVDGTPHPTAMSIIDETSLGNSRQHFRPAPPPSAAPSTTTPTTTP
jgi:hypothetical protein